MSKRMVVARLASLALAASFTVVPSVAAAETQSGGAGSGAVNPLTNSSAPLQQSSSAGAAEVPSEARVDASEPFPSGSSTVVGSVGFLDREQVGYFWSAARGDSVEERFLGPNKVSKLVLKLDVMANGLNSGASVVWIVAINGIDIGQFTVEEGQLGPLTKKFKFTKISLPSYDVSIRVSNNVAPGEGSHTFRYGGIGPHSVKLKKS